MSAETLRTAAALMRERAEAATPGPWVMHGYNETFNVTDGPTCDIDIAKQIGRADSSYIASWHPDVALAVAAWLDTFTDDWPYCDCGDEGCTYAPCLAQRRAHAVATAYLGARP